MAPDPVEDYLLAECATWHGQTDLLIATSSGFDAKEYFEAQLEALAAVGVLTDREVTDWRRRFEDFGGDAELRPDDALRQRVDRYLASLLPERVSDEDDIRELDAALQVLERLGLLSDDDVRRWLERAAPADDDEDDDEDDWPEFACRELRKVLLGPAEGTEGTRLTSVELYDDAVLVRWTASGDETFREPDLRLTDDVGTTYEPTGGSSGGGEGELTRGESTFVRAVPDGASRLFLECDGRLHAFELPP